MSKSSYYQDLLLLQWPAHTPSELVMARLHIHKATLDAIPKNRGMVMLLR